MSNLLYLSPARVRETQTIPLAELVAAFRALARQYPMPARLDRDDELKARARKILKELPKHPELYWHGQNKQACPCASCCGTGYRLIQAHIEEYFGLKASRRRRGTAA